jgi:two-component system sensor histidine kinase DegS
MENGENFGLKFLEEQEFERQRIARELHDSTVQNLTMLIHKTELCYKLIEKDQKQAKMEMRNMGDSLRSSIREMRDIIFDLRPLALEDTELEEALERYAAQEMLQHGVSIQIDSAGEAYRMLPVINTTLFRIIMEACGNAIKHGKPEKIRIELNYEKKYFQCSIEDDGCGFEVKEADKRNKNFGLSIMKERACLLKGHVHIKSQVGKGTRVEVKIPISKSDIYNEIKN